jgi:hypothetical protein
MERVNTNMKRNGAVGVLLLVLVVGALLAGCGGGEAAWAEFKSEEGGFSILMPGKPTEETQTQATELGNIDVYSYTYEEEDVAYMVGYNLLPAAMLEASSSGPMLDGACDGQVSGVSGTEVSRQEIALGAYPGRDLEIRVENADGITTLHTRIYLVENKLYQILVVGREGQSTSPDTIKYLDSFKLLE